MKRIINPIVKRAIRQTGISLNENLTERTIQDMYEYLNPQFGQTREECLVEILRHTARTSNRPYDRRLWNAIKK